MSSAKANCSHGVIDLARREAERPAACWRLPRGSGGQARTRAKSNTHDEVEAIGRLLFLTRDVETDELPLSSLLYLSDSDDELVLDSSDSELEPESEDWRP
jgi:hypothetical protein